MESRETILQELQQISPAVANLGSGNPFSLPPRYFDDFPATVLALVRAENPAFGEKAAPFSVPRGYFDTLAANVLARINNQETQTVEEELNEIAPFLNSIDKKPVYAVPAGYFESLEVTVPLKVGAPARVVGIGKARKIFQYAVAACTAGILMIGAYLYTRNQGNDDMAMTIPYDSAVKMDLSRELSQVNEQEIDQYLNEMPGVGYAINTSAVEEVEVEQYIQSASDEEIDQYLKETAEPGEKIKGS